MWVLRIFVWAGLIFAGAGLAAPQTPPQPPSALEFKKIDEYGRMTISPDGRFAAVAKVNTQKFCLDRFKVAIAKSQICDEKNKVFRTTSGLLVFNLISGEIDRQFDLPIGTDLSCLQFVKNTRLLICLSTLKGQGRAYINAHAEIKSNAITISVGEDKNKYPRADLKFVGSYVSGGAFGTPYISSHPDEERIIVRSGSSILQWTNVYEDDEDEIFDLTRHTLHFLVDADDVPLVRVACNRKDKCDAVQTFYREDEDSDWVMVKEMRKDKELGYIPGLFFPAAIDRDSGQLFVVTRDSGDQRASLKMFDPLSQQYTETIYEHPRFDISNLMFDLHSGEIFGAVVQGNKVEYLINDPEIKKHYDFIASQLGPEQSFRIVGNNIGGERAVVYAASPNKPGKYYIYNPSAQTLGFALDRNSQLANKMNSDSQVLQIKMRDGAMIDAYHYFPKGKEKGAPLLIMPHGGPHVRDYFRYSSSVQFYVSRGYQVVQMNFRGSSGYGVDHEVAGYGEWGGLMQDDVTDTVKFFQNNGYATPEKTCIVGYSYGGFAALYGGATTPELYACIVSGGGVSDLVRSMKDDRVRLGNQTYSFLQQSMGDLRDKDSLKDRSPTRMAEKFRAPVLLIHGERDWTVPPLHSRRMEDALDDLGKDVTYVELEEAGHGRWTLDNQILYLETIEAFLAKHIEP